MSGTSVVGHLAFGAALNVVLFLAVLGWISRLFPFSGDVARPLDAAERLVAWGVVLSACVVVIVTLGGTLGLASRPPTMLALTAACALAPWIGRSFQSYRRGVSESFSALLRSVAALSTSVAGDRRARIALCCVGVPWLLVFSERFLFPPVAWDALTYHLTFPLHWLRSGRLDTLVLPTGDPSQTYYPLVGEMHYYWRFLSTGSDAWSALSQVPYLVVAMVAIAGITRLLGASTSVSVLAAALWAGLPIVLRQSVEPMVDIAITTFVFAGVFLLFRWGEEGGSFRLTLAAAALGLAIGTKYTGLLWFVSTIPLVFMGTSRIRPPRLSSVLGCGLVLVLLGGYAYARNTWTGGNPLLPLNLSVGSVTLLHGFRNAAQYYESDLHRSALAALVASPRALLDLGPVGIASIPFAVLVLIGARAGPGSRMARALAASSLLSVLLFLSLVPYREPRLLLVPIGLAIAAATGAFAGRIRELPIPLALLPLLSIPPALFYWARDLGNSEAWPRTLAGSIAAVALVLLGTSRSDRFAGFLGGMRRLGPIAAALAGVLLIVVAAWAIPRYEAGRFTHWSRFWSTRVPWGAGEPRADLADAAQAWSEVADRTKGGATVAYAGTNIPYPLAGFGLQNRLMFVPRNGNRDSWSYDWGRPVLDSFAGPSSIAWLGNMRSLHVRYLCVFRETGANDPREHFPVEAEWADAHPSMFRPALVRNYVRVYEFDP